ncbi:MAG TPA: NAD(P)/FAD-dependent oxidoreductase [Oscillospiraceae bacterium]|nr:NAD(P)/FAD-dependent oxidoreductase [Oscillospiraceae bacterium]
MRTYDAVVVGAGPSGLGAAIEIAKAGGSTLLIDENELPGGQLFKQIHKFFGSREHYAGIRGYEIGKMLLREAEEFKVDVRLNTRVWGIFPNHTVVATDNKTSFYCRGKKIILATGASENALSFPGSTLPGVMTAGAAQTITNLYRVLPGKNILIVGSGNVGVIVAYQLRQAGANIVAVVDVTEEISGYEVHARKIKRAGIPILLRTTIKEALGEKEVESAILHRVDENFQPIAGSEWEVKVDTICLAVGLTPRLELAAISKCEPIYNPVMGGIVPLHNSTMHTSQEGIYVAGDLAGIEEASSALDEGRVAGLQATIDLGLGTKEEQEELLAQAQGRLNALRQGPFGEKRQIAKESIWKQAENRASTASSESSVSNEGSL